MDKYSLSPEYADGEYMAEDARRWSRPDDASIRSLPGVRVEADLYLRDDTGVLVSPADDLHMERCCSGMDNCNEYSDTDDVDAPRLPPEDTDAESESYSPENVLICSVSLFPEDDARTCPLCCERINSDSC
jgi:hypothetical protein